MGQTLDGKVALITGAASGIGLAMAQAFVAEGARVIVADITGHQDAVADELGAAAQAVFVDVRDEASLTSAVDQAVAIHGRLDVMCNNAGIDGDVAPVSQGTAENFDRVFATNARSVFLGSRAAIGAMTHTGGGAIINTASVSGLVAFPGLGAYAASKGAVLALTRVIAAECAAQGIRCNAICPGLIQTPMLAAVMERNDAAGAGLQMAANATPLARLGEAHEVAAVATFLASDASSFITGAALTVDGGYTAL